METGRDSRRWRGRPVLAATVRAVAHLLPLGVAITGSLWLGRHLPRPSSIGEAVVTWAMLSVVASVLVIAVQRMTRRLLPLSALLQLSLVFPDRAPSRYRVARSTATTKQLEAEVEAARAAATADDRMLAAERVLRLVAALSAHDRATRGHAERVRVFTDMIAEELGLDTADRDRLRWAALLHDVGKIAVHPHVLNKPGRPSQSEWEELRQHPVEGARLVAPLLGWLEDWGLTIEQHHEQWDGSGYPHGLAGSEICMGARIVAVADAFDVMTSRRPYKKAMPPAAARQELARCAGGQFDPRVVRAFLSISLGRLRWAAGPVSWLAHAPLVRPAPALASSPQLVLGGAAALASTALPGADTVPLDRDLPEVPVAQAAEDAGDDAAAGAGADGAMDDGPGAADREGDDAAPGDADVTGGDGGNGNGDSGSDGSGGAGDGAGSGGSTDGGHGPAGGGTTAPPQDGSTGAPAPGPSPSGDDPDLGVDLGDAGSVGVDLGTGSGPVPLPTASATVDILDGTLGVEATVDPTLPDVPDVGEVVDDPVGAVEDVTEAVDDLLPDVEVTVDPTLPDLPDPIDDITDPLDDLPLFP